MAGSCTSSRWSDGKAVARAPASLDGFCAWLVANRHLTAYQADLLRRGQADNFFLNQYRVLERVGNKPPQAQRTVFPLPSDGRCFQGHARLQRVRRNVIAKPGGL